MKKLAVILVLSLCCSVIFSSQVMAEDASAIKWVSQFGTGSADYAEGISADANGVYVTGYTYGVFPDQTGAGSADVFVSMYNLDGTENWTRQFGTSSTDYAKGLSVKATGIYVAGHTYGVFPDQTGFGSADIFVSMYNPDGTENWSRQFGTGSSDYAAGVSVDETGVYVVGYTYGVFPRQTGAGSADVFVSMCNLDGTKNWTRQFGTGSADYAVGISVDETGVYVVGTTYGIFPEQTGAGSADVFISMYNLDGTENWTRQFGTDSADYAVGISVDETGVYVAGYTYGDGSEDAFVCKYNLDGTKNWTRQFGTGSSDYAEGISVDTTGVYVAGTTQGVFPGQTSSGYTDVFLRKYNPDGVENWTRQFGTGLTDYAAGISVDATGMYVAGYTDGASRDRPAKVALIPLCLNSPPRQMGHLLPIAAHHTMTFMKETPSHSTDPALLTPMMTLSSTSGTLITMGNTMLLEKQQRLFSAIMESIQ